MPYFLRVVGQTQPDQVWEVTDREATRLGVENPAHGPGTHFAAGEGEDVWATMRRHTPWFENGADPFHPLDLEPRTYHPRMARPISFSRQEYMRSPSVEVESRALALGIGQALALTRRLDLICQTVNPAPETLAVYGHEIRNLLILAATEVETHWRGVLVANGTTRERLTTAHYARLLRPMRLAEYAVSLPSFPWLPRLEPFRDWNPQNATASLPWYDAYNAAKHDREGAFGRATLGHAMSAVCAGIVMLVAQFTRSAGLGGRGELSAYYRMDRVPAWNPWEVYSDLGGDVRTWTPVQHGNLAIAR